jgi:hypothetical protein
MKRSEAIYLRSILERAVTSLDDKTASTVATLFHRLQGNGELVKAGTRINWNGTVKKAAVDLWDTTENNPDNAPTLWADLAYREGYRIIPEVITVTAAFAEGECGWWNGVLYRSKVSGNVYNPAVYLGNWEEV